jgi:hypothetical protein
MQFTIFLQIAHVVVVTNSELTYYGDSDLEDFADEEDVPEQSKSLEGEVSECKGILPLSVILVTMHRS